MVGELENWEFPQWATGWRKRWPRWSWRRWWSRNSIPARTATGQGVQRWTRWRHAGNVLETEQLMTDIEEAGTRIASLVTAAKQYSQLDRASHQWINVHDGLKSTLVMLTHKLGNGIRVVKDFDRTLPQIPAHPAELNQVWT